MFFVVELDVAIFLLQNISRSVSSLSANSSLESVSENESDSGRSNSDGSVAAVSETDSGYSGNSDEGSELKMTSLNRNQKLYSSLKRKDSYFLKKKVFSEVAMPTLPKSINCLTCPVCQKTMFLDDRGASSLQKHKVMEKIVVNYKMAQLTTKENNFSQRPLCEVCGLSSGAFSSSKCLQCNLSYCKQCEKSSHSDFSNHTVLPLENIDNCNTLTKQRPETNSLSFTPRTNTDYQLTTCLEHPTENLSLYCASCNASMCVLCQQEHKHVTHNVKAIGALFKQQKVSDKFLLSRFLKVYLTMLQYLSSTYVQYVAEICFKLVIGLSALLIITNFKLTTEEDNCKINMASPFNLD